MGLQPSAWALTLPDDRMCCGEVKRRVIWSNIVPDHTPSIFLSLGVYTADVVSVQYVVVL